MDLLRRKKYMSSIFRRPIDISRERGGGVDKKISERMFAIVFIMESGATQNT